MSTEVSEEQKQKIKNHHVVRRMRPFDTQQCLSIFVSHDMTAAKHGMNTYLSIEPDACFVLTSDDDDSEVISFCMGSKYDPRVSIISFYGVKKGYQGLGLGFKVWKPVFDYLSSHSNNMGLAASASALDMYRKGGFVHTDSIGLGVMWTDKKPMIPESQHVDDSIKVIPLKDAIFDDVVSFDESICGLNRKTFLSLTLNEPDSHCMAVVNSAGEVVGVAALKPTGDEAVILGPLYATSQSIATCVLSSLIQTYPGHEIDNGLICFVPDVNQEALKMGQSFGLNVVATAPRIFTTSVPEKVACYEKVFAQTCPGFALY